MKVTFTAPSTAALFHPNIYVLRHICWCFSRCFSEELFLAYAHSEDNSSMVETVVVSLLIFKLFLYLCEFSLLVTLTTWIN